MDKEILFPAEWHPQSGVQLTFPHPDSDWGYMIEEVTTCFAHLSREILKRGNLMIVCHDVEQVQKWLQPLPPSPYKLKLVQLPSNDTWARDHGGISVWVDCRPVVYDFTFNGWGLKFAADADNRITHRLFHETDVFCSEVERRNLKNFILEGGALETDGKGTLLTTSKCLLSPNRNDTLSKGEIEDVLKAHFGLHRVLWLEHGYLAGDDTDSHIDTLARFCNEHTIAYVRCEDRNDEHYKELQAMERQLSTFSDYQGNPYRLIPLPMAPVVVENGERLPATYANFLIMNTAVLVPTYDCVELDNQALNAIQEAFPSREVVGVPCSALIKQHGSLHCVTMQYPEGFLSFFK